jgi:hypothetical protein
MEQAAREMAAEQAVIESDGLGHRSRSKRSA